MDQHNVDSRVDYHLWDIEKTRSLLKGIAASAASPSIPVGTIDASVKPAPKKRVTKKSPSNGSGGGNSQPPSGGGGSGGGSDGTPPDGPKKTLRERVNELSLGATIALSIGVMVVFGVVTIMVNLSLTKAQIPLMESHLVLEEKRIGVERKLFELNQAKKEAEVKASQPVAKPVQSIRMFPCSTVEQRDEGFAQMDIQEIDRRNVSFKAGPGCAWVRLSVPVNSLTGTKFLLNKDNPSSPTGFSGCSTYVLGERKADSHEFCRKFLNRNQGELTRFVVKDDGIILVN